MLLHLPSQEIANLVFGSIFQRIPQYTAANTRKVLAQLGAQTDFVSGSVASDSVHKPDFHHSNQENSLLQNFTDRALPIKPFEEPDYSLESSARHQQSAKPL